MFEVFNRRISYVVCDECKHIKLLESIPKEEQIVINGITKRVCRGCNSPFIPNRKTHQYCSKKCIIKDPNVIQKISEGGKKSASVQSKKRRSKNEKMFASLCVDQFSHVLTNKPIFNGWDADIIIEDIKTAILWNGKWHYEKITEKHSVKQVQNRDKIKINEIKNLGYTPYVIKDMGKFNPTFVQEQFKKFMQGIQLVK